MLMISIPFSKNIPQPLQPALIFSVFVKKVQVGDDQDMAQLVRIPSPKTEVGKKN